MVLVSNCSSEDDMRGNMHISSCGIVTDCSCTNAAGRQSLRIQALFGITPQVIAARSDLEAAGHLIDALDAVQCGSEHSLILGNVAPRNGYRDRWPNGTPFGYLHVGKALVVTTLAGHVLSLVKKLRLAETLYVMDIPTVMQWAVREGIVTQSEAEHITTTQFRSYEFLPRVANWIVGRRIVPSEKARIVDVVPDAPASVWYVDEPFGNVKTTLLPEERRKSRLAGLPFNAHLADVPPGGLSWVVGSSGFGRDRWLELVVNGASAAEKQQLKSGSSLQK